MALDGLFLFELTKELNEALARTRVEKIYQPSKEELVFVMRSKQGAKKLYLNAKADGARVHLTEQNFINPSEPPMLCMFLRKKFTSSWLDEITQNDFERILTFHFSALNDFGDRVHYKIVCEIMGRYSNVIFLDEQGKVMDALKRVGAGKSSVREILPGRDYMPPPPQDKLSLSDNDISALTAHICNQKNLLLSKAILKTLKGISPLRCMELALGAYGEDLPVYEIEQRTNPLSEQLALLKEKLKERACGYMVLEGDKPLAFSFLPIEQFGSLVNTRTFSSLSELLDCFYQNRLDTVKRTQSGAELLKKINATIEKLSRKSVLLQKELTESENSEQFKLYGELINANLYYLEESVSEYELLNYYTGEKIRIPANPTLTPGENAAKYYKEYRKKQTAKTILAEQLHITGEQLEYLESVLAFLERAETPAEIAALKKELAEQGFLKIKASKKEKNQKELKPLEFQTTGGFRVLVGRNNLSNDKLTFKTAKGNDLWFHTKAVHGAHAVLVCDGKEPSEEDIVQAASISAYYSKARDDIHVPVDYTRIKFVKRQPSRIPGRVFYTEYKTVYVSARKEQFAALMLQ